MKINVRDLGRNARAGRRGEWPGDAGKLLVAVGAEPERPEPVFLNFAGVEVATASFLRESVLAFRVRCAAGTRISIR